MSITNDLPTFRFEIWRSDWGVVGNQIEQPYALWLGKYARRDGKLWLFNGQTAICEVLTLDSTISRAMALKFVNCVNVGRFWVVSFDLARCTVQKMAGWD